ncbi:MAG: gliding motility-associated lipoprotein GldD [Crocinitomicaceae bacterium]|jgi:gliding motility-associated lipoprotein GldD
MNWKLGTVLLSLIALSSCEEEINIPKPPAYLRLELPDHSYTKYVDSCQYSFDLASIYKIENTPDNGQSRCHRRINLGPLNGTIYFRYWDMEEPLSYYVNNANDEIDRHKGKAIDVNDKLIIREKDDVYGIIFQLDGDVATPFQFYLTDSTNRFAYGEVLFNMSPNYDSLKPTLDYLKKDLDQLLETFKWSQ